MTPQAEHQQETQRIQTTIIILDRHGHSRGQFKRSLSPATVDEFIQFYKAPEGDSLLNFYNIPRRHTLMAHRKIGNRACIEIIEA